MKPLFWEIVPKNVICTMLDGVYLLFILALTVYLLLSAKKELPIIVVVHAVLQYILTLVMWFTDMSPYLAGVLLAFMVSTTGLLIWGRSLNYSRDHQMIKVFVALGQWTVMVSILLFLMLKSPYSYHFSSLGSGNGHSLAYSTIHPFIKLCGNLLLFTTFLQVILSWGTSWSIKQSLRDLGPIVLYFLLTAILFLLESPFRHHAFT